MQAVEHTLKSGGTRQVVMEAFQSMEAKISAHLDEVDASKGRARKITLTEYLKRRREEGKAQFDPDSAVVNYPAKIKLPPEWAGLAWRRFRNEYSHGTGKTKTYIDWAAVFLKSMKDDWFKLFRFDNKTGQWVLTDNGMRALAEAEAEKQR